MCLILFSYRQHPRYPLLLAANRDEFHARPTQSARFWPERPKLLAGRDLQAGGTWMGITRNGRFAAVTNFRDPERTRAAPRSRGDLTLGFLEGDESPASYLHRLSASAGEYAGFNLLLGDRAGLWYYSNSAPTPSAPQQLQPGTYGLSNALLDTPWPKVQRGKQALRSLTGGAVDHSQLAEVVASGELAEQDELAEVGLHGEMDQMLSAQFIVNEAYGTRATTTLWQDQEGMTSWRELSFDAGGNRVDRVTEQFLLER
ncbi:NRDE family protein [Halioglobus maricola]|uniref:NRDE family protein n=1 Tax=Halioglobus maricola TaxID=2601894 RepID=A0A5P9NNQ0_9GAMM|nr:NRDE family protein [Halioglobus maricola]QFU77493.1 NRDE family protein [Halioglobus maricola]